MPLNLIQEDKIIFSSAKNFLVIRHAVIEDIDFLNFIFNINQEIYVDINANHEVYKRNNDNVYRTESKFKGKIRNISIDSGIDRLSGYKVTIELNEIDLFYKTYNIKPIYVKYL